MSSSFGHKPVLAGIFASWMAQAFTVSIGFLMPRLINDSIGPVELGIWDLCWSLLIFFGASNFGVGPALIHYQVRWEPVSSGGLSRDLLPTAGALQCGLALVSGAAFCGFLYVAYRVLNDSADTVPSSVLETIALLALTVVVLLIGDLGQSLFIANHRHETGEYLSITSDVTLAASMTIVLIAGGGLLALASTTLLVRAVFETQRVLQALRLTESEERGEGHWSTSVALVLLRYSSKSMINGVLDLAYPIGVRFALFLSAGPVALASYSRLATLQRQILRIAERSLLVLPALASARADPGEPGQVAALSIRASRLTVLMMTPLLIIFALFGSDIVSIWMGPEFMVSGVAVLLACSIFLSLDRIVVNCVLSGINSHGRIGLMCHGCALVLCALGYLFMHPLEPLDAGGMILIAATGLALPQFVLASRRFGMGVLHRARLVYLDPVLCNAPGAAFLLFSHVLFHEQRFFAAVFMGAAGLLSVPLMHWVWVLDEDTRVRLRRLVLRSGS